MRWLAGLTLAVVCASLCVGEVTVELRGEPAGTRLAVAEMGFDGVALASRRGVDGEWISWDRVRRIIGDEDAAGTYLPIATRAWRARARLERGDVGGAEPLFEALYMTYRGRSGPTAALVCEGLLRCRLRNAATAAAVPVWLAWLETSSWRPSQGLAVTVEGLGQVADRATGLVPSLPPVFAGPGTIGVVAALQTADTGMSDRTDALRRIYHTAAALSAGEMDALQARGRLEEAAALGVNDPAVELCHAIVLAACGDGPVRRDARSLLSRRIGRAATHREPDWIEAWCRLGLGQSLIGEAETEAVRLGIIELLHVAVRLDEAVPLVAGTALGLAAEASFRIGDAPAGSALLLDLLDRFPGHPVLGWEPLLERTESRPPTAGSREEPA